MHYSSLSMSCSSVAMVKRVSLFLLLFILLQAGRTSAIDYADALTKSLLFFEAQRSGKLPSNQRVLWRADSAMNDGRDAGVNLTGGYYDAGDNVKFGFPLAFTVTLLSWGAVEFESQLRSRNEFGNALATIKWGTDYLIRAHPQPNVLYGQVGDGNSDHACWMRPEDMTTPRTSYQINTQKPGTDLAAETAAAFAAASIAFAKSDAGYASKLARHSRELFDFAVNYKALYSQSIPSAQGFYSSSGYNDELLWAAAWLQRATQDEKYLNFLGNQPLGTGGLRSEFSWDDKFSGAQALVSLLVMEGKVGNTGIWADYKNSVEQFVCSCVQKGNNNVQKSPGGLLSWHPWNPLQYVTGSMLLVASYSQYLDQFNATLRCPRGEVQPTDLVSFVKSQIDYILGSNPKKMSYMVGFGSNFPQLVHHRAASIVSIKKDGSPVGCKDGFDKWFNKNSPNPNVLVGALVGGPDSNDGYSDSRSNYQQAEPTTVNAAAIVGVLAKLSA